MSIYPGRATLPSVKPALRDDIVAFVVVLNRYNIFMHDTRSVCRLKMC